jgi:GT2 family glycosyltransferase
MNNGISVLTLVQGRQQALLNLIKGLAQNEDLPQELVIVYMNEDYSDLPAAPFPIRGISCYTTEKLPLAKARNMAMANAAAENCIFLDVDCIPAPNFITLYRAAFSSGDQLWSGQVRYLKQGFPEGADPVLLHEWSAADPVRANLPTLPYELFWSLNFGCSKTVFAQIKGFDERYTGYGAEDTDFAFGAREMEIPLGLIHAMAYHQPHASYSPPLNHLQDIVQNANVFYQKWQRWPMEGWLQKFADLGYVSWTGNNLFVTRIPESAEITQYLK